MKKAFLTVVLIQVLSLTTFTRAAFLDDFENPGMVAYTYQDSYGRDGSYSIAGGKLNITAAYNNTATVTTTDTVNFAVGDTLSLDVPPVSGNHNVFLVCSTAAGQPDGTRTFGFRFHRDCGGLYARINLYPGGIPVNTMDPAPDKPATLNVQRISDASFVYSITIQGLRTPLGSFTLTQLAGIYNLHIGAQAYDQPSSTSSFDNLCIRPQTIHNITQNLGYNSIQSSIDDANNMDQIEVGPGTYHEAINFNGKAIHLYSSGGPDVTTINGDGAYHVVQCISGEGSGTILEGFIITGGDAHDGGGGMCNFNSSPTVTHCTFSGNTADFSGGGMYNDKGSSPMVTHCTFSGNTADNGLGGGMYNDNGSSPTVTNCTFSGNTAYYGGGGMYNYSYRSPTVTHCTFSGNTTYYNGGGMYNDNGSSPTVTNCTFSGNTALHGGGIYNDNSSPTVTNCTFSGNEAYSIIGGGMYNYYSNANITNSIFWGDSSEISDDSSTPIVTYCDVQGGYAGTGNININPLFVNAAGGDLRLAPDSPCIDAGNNAAVLSGVFKDLAGKYRFADDPLTADTGTVGTTGRPVVDMGVYEYQGPATTSQNLLANGGFETGNATGWITNWGFGLSASPIQVHTGTYSGLTSNRTASWQGAWQSVKGLMDDGKTYRISGWVKLENADSDRVALTIAQTDSAGARYDGVANATAYGDRWTFLDGTYALDVIGQLSGLHIYFEGPAAGVNFYIDDASVTEVKSDLNHDGHVDLMDFSLLAAYYGLDCSTQDCGRANLEDYDSTIDTLDLAVLAVDWLLGVQ